MVTVFDRSFFYQALPCPLPDDMRSKLMVLGEAAIKARKASESARMSAMADDPSLYIRAEIQTPEGKELDAFVERMRSEIGVTVIRDWLGRGSPPK